MFHIDANILIETEHLGSNNGIICTPEGLVLVDLPHRPSDAIKWRRLAESMARQIYITHRSPHRSHHGKLLFSGTIVSHAMTRERLQNAAPTRQYLEDLLAVIDPAR